jgi:hypothetical protein
MMIHNGRLPKRFPRLTTGDGDSPSLTGLLRHYLFEVVPDGKTRAQKLVEALVEDAEKGNLKSLQEILIRIDGEAKSREEVASPVLGEVDELKAQKILEALNDDLDDPPGD